jgi:hypothetical protein
MANPDPQRLIGEMQERNAKLKDALKEIIAGYDWCVENGFHDVRGVICEAIEDGRKCLNQQN